MLDGRSNNGEAESTDRDRCSSDGGGEWRREGEDTVADGVGGGEGESQRVKRRRGSGRSTAHLAGGADWWRGGGKREFAMSTQTRNFPRVPQLARCPVFAPPFFTFPNTPVVFALVRLVWPGASRSSRCDCYPVCGEGVLVDYQRILSEPRSEHHRLVTTMTDQAIENSLFRHHNVG